MPATDAQIALIRDWVGDTTPTDEEISDKFDVEGSVDKTALSFLKRRRANLLQDPASWNGSDYSESWPRPLTIWRCLLRNAKALFTKHQPVQLLPTLVPPRSFQSITVDRTGTGSSGEVSRPFGGDESTE